MKGNEISFIAGKLADAETLIAAKVRTAAGLLAQTYTHFPTKASKAPCVP